MVTTVVGIAITVALLAWTLKGVSFSEVIERARTAHPVPIIIAVLLATFTFVLRMFRWRLLLRSDQDQPIPYRSLWHAIAIGFMANNLLPLRAGEFLRAYSINRLEPVRLTSALSSLVVERLLDAIVVVALLLISLTTAGIPADATIAGIKMSAVASRGAILCAILLVAVLSVLFFPLQAEALIRKVIPAKALADRLVTIVEGIRQGLASLSSPRRIIGAVLWSFAVWLVNCLAFYVAFAAFDIQVGFSGAMLMQSILVFGIATPSTPGFFGVFEGVIKAILSTFGVAAGPAVSYGLTYHITTYIPITLLGLWSLTQTPIDLKAARQTKP
ncbi:MAG: lysylphosphatidylglycerol synthase transmembrane domain-containing protein [Gemmatimonadota bacterium]